MTKNRVTVEEIKAAIRKKEFVVLPDGRTTICILTMDNGFTIRGGSLLRGQEELRPGNRGRGVLQECLQQMLGFPGIPPSRSTTSGPDA